MPKWGSSNVYPQQMFYGELYKIIPELAIIIFFLKYPLTHLFKLRYEKKSGAFMDSDGIY